MNRWTLGNEINTMQRIIRDAQDVIKGKKEMLREMQKGGFSDDVFEQKYLQDYINDFDGNCLGYIGNDRKKSDDRFLEKNWKGSKKELAQFLCSRSGSYYLSEEVRDDATVNKYYKEFLSDL